MSPEKWSDIISCQLSEVTSAIIREAQLLHQPSEKQSDVIYHQGAPNSRYLFFALGGR